mgnify:CR=1 FL=1
MNPKKRDLTIKENPYIMNEEQLKKYVKKQLANIRAEPTAKQINPYKISQPISFKVLPEDYILIKERAEQEGWSISKLIRYCLYSEGITICCK